jgi:hypothetical protein
MTLRPAHLFLAAAWALSACGSSDEAPRILRVALQTDLGPDELQGASFAFTVRRLDDDPASMPQLTRTLGLDELDPAPADLPGEGLRSRFGVRALVAEGLPEGRYEVDVEVSGIDPVRRASTAAFSLSGVRDVTLSVLAEPGVACMVDADCAPSPCAESECWSGLCATLRDPEDPAVCECDDDADCDRASLGLSGDDCRSPACITRERPDGTEEQVCAADFTGSACDAGTVCAATDDPDVFGCAAITCEGRAPGDTCRPAAGDCDVAEVCGEGPDCPPDRLAPAFSLCSLAGGAPGGTCDGLGACVPPAPECTSTADCDDGFACTDDVCTIEGTCRHTSRDEECGVATSACVSARRCDAEDPAADESTGCVDVFAPAGADCGNSDLCTDPDLCDGRGTCVVYAAPIACETGSCTDGRCGCVPGAEGDAACNRAFGVIFPGECALNPSSDPCSTAGTERQTVRTSVCGLDGLCSIPADSFRDVPCVVPSEGRTCGDTTTTSTACAPDPGECPISGTRVETRTSRVCRSGVCAMEPVGATLACVVSSDRLPCGPPQVSTGACGGFSASNPCDETGVATRTTLRTLCNGGLCDPDMTSMTTTTVACSRDSTDGDRCDLDPCSPGVCAIGNCLGTEACISPCICGRAAFSTMYTCILDPRSGRDLGMTECFSPIPVD